MKNDYKRFDFWIRKENGNIFYYMRADKQWIQVSKEVYSLCRNSYRKINRDNNRDKDIVFHCNNFEFKVCNNLNNSNIIDGIYKDIQIQTLRKALNLLSEKEKEIILFLFFEAKTERETAIILNLPYSTLHNKKVKILEKLKKILEQEGF